MRHALLVILIGLLNTGVGARARDVRCAAAVDGLQPTAGVIASEDIAKAIALAYLVPVYGEATIHHEMPLHASLSDGIWTVNGTLPTGWVGGTAEIRLCQRNGTVLSLIHSK